MFLDSLFGRPSDDEADGRRLTLADLVAEGRRLQRPCSLLKPHGDGPVAAVWHGDLAVSIDGEPLRAWMTIDSARVPGLASQPRQWLLVCTEADGSGGRLGLVDEPPAGTPLHAHPAEVIAPIDAVIALGSPRIDPWLARNGWARDIRYDDHFADHALVEAYDRTWFAEYPLHADDPDPAWAVLGGWHWPNADDDWHDLLDHRLLAMTLRDAQPWVEAWQTLVGEWRVVQRTG